MPAYQLYVYEEQEKREALEQRICEQVDACTEVNGKIRNRVKKFLIEEGITDISEMNAALRVSGKKRNRSCTDYLPSGIRQNFPPSDEGRTKNAGRTEEIYYRVS